LARTIPQPGGGHAAKRKTAAILVQDCSDDENHPNVVDSGLEWRPAHSGKTVWQSADMEAMLAAARRGEFDVLLVGYYDRWQRNLRRFLELIEDTLHPSGVSLVMCDSNLLSSNGRDWQRMKEQANRAEDYSLDLGRRIQDGIAAKAARPYGDQHGTTPLGFRRTSEHLLEINPETIGQAVHIFERYATGMHSFRSLGAEVGMAPERVREILAAPIFNGFYRIGKRSKEKKEQRPPAPWRSNPPVSDELWDRVQEVRRSKHHGGGQHREDRIDPLAGLVYCTCGKHIKSNGTSGTGVPMRTHPVSGDHWDLF
jgi:DNA invertase Pin-like site-specific DNA recombinase